MTYNDFKQLYNAANTGLELHHTALSRGYITRTCGYVEEYNGRFGQGYRVHVPNCQCKGMTSNTYHIIIYFINK